jgi:hypothetical protein
MVRPEAALEWERLPSHDFEVDGGVGRSVWVRVDVDEEKGKKKGKKSEARCGPSWPHDFTCRAEQRGQRSRPKSVSQRADRSE